MHAWLKTAIPKLASLDIERSVSFYEQFGFNRVAVHPTLALISRGPIELHFWLTQDPTVPQTNGARVNVSGIDALYDEFLLRGAIHPNDPLGDKPWGKREFSILDVDGNVLTFAAEIPAAV
jgi:hypothetical protein